MASSLSQLSACVTRILSLTGFPKELKTKDIQAAFSEWENVNGGFKIKWIDDTSLLIVFNDATAAKRAYLHTLAFPPAIFANPNSTQTATIKPYDGPDAQAVIQNVNSRQHTTGRGHNVRNSVSHGRGLSMSNAHRGAPANAAHTAAGNGNGSGNGSPRDRDREPSPTLPNLPSQPTLNSLISSSLGGGVAVDPTAVDPAIVAALPDHGAPRIGDPGKRMLGAALGVRHPGLGPRAVNGASTGGVEVQRAMAGLVIAE
ncbi:uncharacterized protein LAESUDRAFT_742325 [Laetiporus sulphureus 93-53]|uniref:Uncharacterized protein n=1 Tax=Laetiporus sulphureus 93-53 TaxID=1314785 RepID=A0A165F8Y2_9APHY|nr:uncharacterized protein LAESUDRAFT_742325 [Laetiporus sulphureus 93-53]KZT08613.1 hypothetical protein LAESUDRAFT_742325 [Laetiporus sulphureus 93-53]